MEELVEQAVVAERKRNRGWFQPGDRRINREGRPRGSPKAEPPPRTLEIRADGADRLMRVSYTTNQLCELLRTTGGVRVLMSNLPDDCEIVDIRVYHNGLIILVIRSKSFPRIAEGSLIPKFEVRLASRE
jgi:hypothetical protein